MVPNATSSYAHVVVSRRAMQVAQWGRWPLHRTLRARQLQQTNMVLCRFAGRGGSCALDIWVCLRMYGFPSSATPGMY